MTVLLTVAAQKRLGHAVAVSTDIKVFGSRLELHFFFFFLAVKSS